ncbi:hypothetical protein [Streptomyces sp. NPDC059753]|uniref:hypothetical protein n=1 Tax=Streptomyces sp. NPDC059753 TaxID=3346933 RepID=UPI003669B164
MIVEGMTTPYERPSTTLRRTGIAGRLFRAAVTAHTVASFGQPVFAGVYLTGEIGGLDWHARGADVVFSLALVQAAASALTRSLWPISLSVLIVSAEAVQYMAGVSGLLWVHFPLGVMLIAALAVLSAAVWVRPLPNRAGGDRAGEAGEPGREETHA